jgi:hypothetical protein
MFLLPSRTGPAGPAEPGVACLWQAPPGRLSIVASKLFANDLRTQLRLCDSIRPLLLASVPGQPAIGSRPPVVPIGVNFTLP